MLLALIVLVIGAPILWTISVGALRDAHRARQLDPRTGCQAWVTFPGIGRRSYRCSEPVDPGGSWCRRHEVELARGSYHVDPAATLVDEPQAAGRALALARVGVPAAIAVTLATVGLLVWFVARTM